MEPNRRNSSIEGSASADSSGDAFDVEVQLLKNNPEFMTLMKQMSQEKAAISLQDLRQELSS